MIPPTNDFWRALAATFHPNPRRDVDEAEAALEATREAAIEQVMGGLGEFWPTGDWTRATDAPRYDNEQHISLIVAVRDALKRWDWDDDTKWDHVARAVEAEAAKFAAYRVREAI